MDSCNYPPSEKRPRWGDITSMQAARPSIIRYASSITSSLDQPGASQASVSSAQTSMQPGRKFKREWIDSHNASVSSSQDRGVTPYQALPGPSRPMQGENDVAPTALNMQAANLNVSFQILFLANDSFFPSQFEGVCV